MPFVSLPFTPGHVEGGIGRDLQDTSFKVASADVQYSRLSAFLLPGT